jgi:hypothetical protein
VLLRKGAGRRPRLESEPPSHSLPGASGLPSGPHTCPPTHPLLTLSPLPPNPQGDIVAASPNFSHVLPTVFERPLAYEPERFAPPREEDKRKAFSFIGFGGGRHACIGQNFAYLQIKAIWSVLLVRAVGRAGQGGARDAGRRGAAVAAVGGQAPSRRPRPQSPPHSPLLHPFPPSSHPTPTPNPNPTPTATKVGPSAPSPGL